MLTTLVLSLSVATTPPPTNASQAGAVIALFGQLTEQGDPFCNKENKTVWINRRFEVGFVRVTKTATELKPFLGKPVVVTGRVASIPKSIALMDEGSCPVPQMRSDMVRGPSGIRTQGSPAPIQGFEVESIRELTELRAQDTKTTATIYFDRNRGFRVGLTVRAHYEGCYGKPGSTTKEQHFPSDVAVEFNTPKVLTADKRRYRLSSVSVHSDATDALFDLDIPVRLLGVITKCGSR